MTETQTEHVRKRGPRPTGIGVPVQTRIQPDLLAALDEIISKEAIGGEVISRPEMIRRILMETLSDPVKREAATQRINEGMRRRPSGLL